MFDDKIRYLRLLEKITDNYWFIGYLRQSLSWNISTIVDLFPCEKSGDNAFIAQLHLCSKANGKF